MTVRRLLKSYATPPASLPMPSNLWACIKALLRFAQRNLSLARPVFFAREPQGLPAGEHEHQCEDQRDADQADLSTPGIEKRLYRCHILAGHVAPLLENPGEFAF